MAFTVYPLALMALMALGLGLYVGEWFPDVDQKTSLLLHRSILTHGLLLPLTVYLVASRIQFRIVRWLAMGVNLGVAVHLAFDLFPRAWKGYALVSLPFYGWMPPLVSWVWIALVGFACFYMAAKLVRDGGEGAVLVVMVCGLVVYVYALPGEHALWRPIATLVVDAAAATFAALLTYQRPKRGAVV